MQVEKKFCRICGKWLDPETWEKHQKMNLREHLKIKYFYGEDSILSQVDMRPTEREQLKRVMKMPSYRPIKLGRFVNKVVYNELMYGIKTDGHLILQIFGTQGSGKSTLALKIALLLKRAWKKFYQKDVDIKLSFSFYETLRMYKQSNPGDIIIQDEAPSMMGIDSRITVESLENLLALMRARMNTWIFCYPKVIKELVSPTLFLEVWGRIPEKKWTLAMAYSRLLWCIGWAVFDVSEVFKNKELLEYYLKRKLENLRKIQESEGRVSATFEEEKFEEVLEKVRNIWIKKGRRPIQKKSDVEKYMILANLHLSTKMWKIYRDMLYDELVADYEKTVVDEETTKKEVVEEKEIKQPSLKIGVITGDFRVYILENLNNIDWERYGFDGDRKRFAKLVLKSLFEEAAFNQPVMTQLQLCHYLLEKYNWKTTNYTLSKLGVGLSESGIIGALFEKWFHEKHGIIFTGRKGAGVPDFIHPETNVAYSLKTCFGWRKARSFIIHQECRPEIEHTRNNNLEYFYLVFINPLWWSEPRSVRIPINDIPYSVSFHIHQGVQVFSNPVRKRDAKGWRK